MDNHNLANEFPEYQDKIHYLKQSDRHFANLFEQYEDINKKIARSEQRIELMSELEEEVLRKERMKIKDELYQILSA